MDNQPIDGTDVPSGQGQAGAEIPDDVLNQLLGTVAKPDSGNSDSDGDQSGTAAKPTLNDQWKAQGLDLDDLYKGTVSLSDDMGTATIEQLKKDATKFRKGQAQQTEFADERTEFANEKLRAMQELQTIVAAIPTEHVSEQLKQQYGAYQQAHQEQQERILLQAIPGWADQAVKAKDAKAMVALTAEYGLPASALDAMTEAGWLKLVYDYTQLKQRIAGIKDKRKEPKAKGNKVTSPQQTGRADRFNAAKAGGDKIGAIAALLQGT